MKPESHQYLLLNLTIFFCCFAVSQSLNASTSSSMLRCLPGQSSILLQLKQEFTFKNPFYEDSTSYPKMKTWKAGSDCCSWDGVRCSKKTGGVESLDLSIGGLQGPLHPNSSLFSLNQIQRLNLAYNNFSLCSIPSEFGQLSRLTYLNLSSCNFSGFVPYEIWQLTKLISLDLSSSHGRLFLRKVDQTRFIKNMTNLRELDLSGVNLSSSSALLLESLVNLSSLTSLSLADCGLIGEFPKSIFLLDKLQAVDAWNNRLLTGFLPEFNSSSHLKSLRLSNTNFSGTLPHSIGNLKSLNILNLYYSNFSGTVPSSIGNLSQLTNLDLSLNNFFGRLPDSIGNLKSLNVMKLYSCNFSGTFPYPFWNLSQITSLDLSFNNFNGQLPDLWNLTMFNSLSLTSDKFSGEAFSSLGNGPQLEYLGLRGNNFSGQIPPSLASFNRLTSLSLSYNNFDGAIPSFLFNMPSLSSLDLGHNRFAGALTIHNISSTKLVGLTLSGNKLNGKIPGSLSQLTSLAGLYLDSNNFSGRVDFDIFSNMKNMRSLDLSDNSISMSKLSMNSTFHMFQIVRLSSCNISEFPDFLKDQNQLTDLDLSNNKIGGHIPKWFLSTGIKTLTYLNLSSNFISGWEQPPLMLPWNKMLRLDLHSNQLRGSPVVPPLSTLYFFISKNNMAGNIHPLFCELSNLIVLDISNNHLGGTIPECLGNFSSSLKILNLKGNNLHGKIPHMSTNASNLKTLDLSHNQLQGKVPKSLLSCKDLRILNLGHNKINDTFPFWLQNMLELQVLVLRSNNMHGPIWDPHKFFGFMKLRIIDLSFNSFSGSLPSEYFSNWSSMTRLPNGNESQLRYMGDKFGYYVDSVILMNKGLEMTVVKMVLAIITSIDLSNNRLSGAIPSTIGDLQSLVVLNLSSNSFTGLVPSSLGNLTELESLDLSRNKLNGRIPQELTSLTFLAYLNMSENNLTGPIPQGRQFDTFLNSSFEGNNPGLCGSQLSKKCESDSDTPNSGPDNESESGVGFSWKGGLVGYGYGLVLGVVIGHITISRRLIWFLIRNFCGNTRI